jgi:tryptophan-rich sensory protein
MGTTANEAVLSFMTIFVAVFAVTIAAAIRASYLVYGKWFKCGERPRNSLSVVEHADERSWYEQLRKTRGFPGTMAYILTWLLVFFLEAYCAWRIWINVPAQANGYGSAYLYLVFFHVLMNAVASELLFGMQSLTWALFGQVFSFILSGIALVMLGLVTFKTTLLPSVTVFVLQAISTTGVLAALVCVFILRVKNPEREYQGLY